MNNIVFITGTSGSGKSYIKEKLIELFPEKYYRIVQYTTRDIRKGEENGKDYNFINKEDYNSIKHSLFCKTKINNNFYGTPTNFINNKIAVIVVNASGLEDGIKYLNNKFNYIILDIENNSPIERIDRDKEFVDLERKNINSVLEKINSKKIIKLINNPEHYLNAKDVDMIIQHSI